MKVFFVEQCLQPGHFHLLFCVEHVLLKNTSLNNSEMAPDVRKWHPFSWHCLPMFGLEKRFRIYRQSSLEVFIAGKENNSGKDSHEKTRK